MPRSRLLLSLSAGLIALLILGCGGDKKDSTAASGGSGSTRSVDLSKAATTLEDLKSFRFDIAIKLDFGSQGLGGLGSPPSSSTPSASAEDAFADAFLSVLLGGLGDIRMEGAFVSPDQIDMKMKLGGMEFAYVQLGQKAWIKSLNKWEVTEPDGDIQSFGSPTELFSNFIPLEVLEGGKTSRESVNGSNATHYAFDKAALQKLSAEMGEGDFNDVTDAKLDVWLTDDNVPVKVSMNVAGKDESGQKMSIALEMNVRDINKAIAIKPPI